MGVVYDSIEDVREWVERQRMFFVGTAPSGDAGHINVSPKGDMATFQVLGPDRVAYVDLFGSGIETVAHLRDNGRIVVMLCAFEGPPKVVRLHGRGRVIEQANPEYEHLLARFHLPPETLACARSIVDIEVERVADSCGFVVPQMPFEAPRRQLQETAAAWTRKRGRDAVRDYCDVNNATSIDGLPGIERFGEETTEEQAALYGQQGRKL